MIEKPMFFSLVASCVALLISLPLDAFVRTKTCYPTGQYACTPGEIAKEVCWEIPEINYVLQDGGTDKVVGQPPGLPPALQEAIIAGFETWNEVECTALRFVYGGTTPVKAVEYVGRNRSNINVLLWRDDDWPHASRIAYALTSVTFDPSDGIIRDADIEMNSTWHQFTISNNPDDVLTDVRNTITHEAGHFLGLDHSAMEDATMFERASQKETKKRDLHEDDIAGLCNIYRVDGTCTSPYANLKDSAQDSCCAVPGTQPRAPLKAVLLVLATCVLWRRARTTRPNPCCFTP
jgi:hypothetical protein